LKKQTKQKKKSKSKWSFRVFTFQDQDEHDFDKCVRALLAHSTAPTTALLDVLVLGGLGGSVTHEFASFNTLIRYSGHPRIRLSLISDECFATVAPPGLSSFRLARQGVRVACGIIPIGEPAHDVTTTGFRWNLGLSSK
jgi:thiamine pyrophosphokinase